MNSKPRSVGPWTLGLDIGIASVGWAALSPTRIIDLGCARFRQSGNRRQRRITQSGPPPARLLRRRLWRRAWRLTKAGSPAQTARVIESLSFFKDQPGFTDSTWVLRRDGLNRLADHQRVGASAVSPVQTPRLSLVQQGRRGQGRGRHQGRRRQGQEGPGADSGADERKGYRSAAEMVLAEFPEAQRNKQGRLQQGLSRVLLDDELASSSTPSGSSATPRRRSGTGAARHARPARRPVLVTKARFGGQRPAQNAGTLHL
jgi:CRISPR-associated endonuclease Csn1